MIEQRDTKWLTSYLLVGETALAEQLVQNERVCVQLLLWTFETVLRPYNGAAAIILLYRRWLEGDAPTAEEWKRATDVGAAASKRYSAAGSSIVDTPEMPASWAIASATTLVGALQSAAFTNLAASHPKTLEAQDAATDAHRKASTDKVRELLAS